MANDKVPVTTPKGELYYVNISGQGKQNYNEDGYEYTATVYCEKDDPETVALIEKIDELIGPVPKGKTLKSQGYRPVWKNAEGNYFVPTANRKGGDEEGDEETTLLAFAFKTGTTFEDGKTKKINVFNSKAGKISLGDKKIGNGSIGRISGKMKRNENGKDISVSLFLNGVQINKFVEYVDDGGFEADDDEEGFMGVETDGTEGMEEDNSTDTSDAAEETSKPAKSSKGKAKPRL